MSIKHTLRSIFSPILGLFESGTEEYSYRPSHRNILLFIGALFSALSILVLWLSQGEDPAYLLPVSIFAAIGFTSLLVGILGSDRAVAKIWGNTRK